MSAVNWPSPVLLRLYYQPHGKEVLELPKMSSNELRDPDRI